MQDCEDIIESVCQLPNRTRRQNLSPVQYIKNRKIAENRHCIRRRAIQRYLSRYPAIVEDWLSASLDTRTGRGWYFLEGARTVSVGYYPGGPDRAFFGREKACACFIVRELESMLEPQGHWRDWFGIRHLRLWLTLF